MSESNDQGTKVAGAILLVGLLLLGTGVHWLWTHPDALWRHMVHWKLLYLSLAFLVYLGLTSALTGNAFSDVSYSLGGNLDDHRMSLGRMTLRAVVFFVVASLIVWRWSFLMEMLHVEGEYPRLALAFGCGFALLFALWPTTSFRSMAYLGVLVHIRFVYLLGSILITGASLLVSALVLALVTAVVAGAAAAVYFGVTRVWSGTDSAFLGVLPLIFLIALFMAFARKIVDFFRLLWSESWQWIRTLSENGRRQQGRLRDGLREVYEPVCRMTDELGDFMGGNIA